ncbi:MAG TPA: energy transducer TonB, partial [Syntrophales bacterium]
DGNCNHCRVGCEPMSQRVSSNPENHREDQKAQVEAQFREPANCAAQRHEVDGQGRMLRGAKIGNRDSFEKYGQVLRKEGVVGDILRRNEEDTRIRALVAPSKFVHSPTIQRLTMIFACSILLITGAGTGLVFVRAQDKPAPAGQGQAPRSSDDVTLDISDKRVTPPKVLDQTIPSYTEEALSRRIQGIVLLECIIRTNGRATDFRLLRRLGSGLDEAAIREIRDSWKFTPATLKGKPVSVRAKIEVTFNLRTRQAEISPSEAEGLAIEAVHLIGLSEAEATRARAVIKMQDSTRFQKTAFDSDVRMLTEKFGLTRESVYKSSSGGVVIKYWFPVR